MSKTTHKRRVTTLSKALLTAGLLGVLLPERAHASQLTGTLFRDLQQDLIIEYLAQSDHGLTSLNPSFSLNPGNVGDIIFANLGPDIHGTTARHGVNAAWTETSANIFDYILTPLVSLSPACTANFVSCSEVEALTSFFAKPGPGVVLGTNFALARAKGVEAVPAPLPLFGVAAAFDYSRRLRKRIKISKRLEVMSGIG